MGNTYGVMVAGAILVRTWAKVGIRRKIKLTHFANLQQCYRCAIFDGKQDGEVCYPWETNYTILSAHANKGLKRKCARSNPRDDCAFRTCCCETQFAEDLFDLYFESAVTGVTNYNSGLKHSKGFDWDAECVASPPNEFERGCCGEYPERYPYNKLKDECPADTP